MQYQGVPYQLCDFTLSGAIVSEDPLMFGFLDFGSKLNEESFFDRPNEFFDFLRKICLEPIKINSIDFIGKSAEGRIFLFFENIIIL